MSLGKFPESFFFLNNFHQINDCFAGKSIHQFPHTTILEYLQHPFEVILL